MHILLILLTTIVFSSEGSNKNKGYQIAQKSEIYNQGFKGEESEMKMILLNASGEKIERRMLSKIKEIQIDGDRSLITFTWPADVKGTKMLTWTHKQGDDQQWLYLPAFKRVKRISSRNKSGSFMGSEFSYEDLSSQELEKFTYKYIKDDKANSREAWVIERFPSDKKSGYTKQVLWMDKEYLNATKLEYYDRKGDLLKTSIFSDYKKHQKWWRAGKIIMHNHQTEKKSILTWTNRSLGKSFSSKIFNKRNLNK